MKKLLFAFILISNVSFSQNFPAYDVNLLLDKEIKVIQKNKNLQKYGYEGFFKNKELKKKFNCCESHNSKYAGLVGKVFKVLSAEPYKNIIGVDKYKLKIENSEVGIIYFDYNPKYEHSFPFEVIGGLDLPKDFYCKKLKVKKDKFEDKITTSTPYASGISFVKVERNSNQVIYFNINETGSTLAINKKGLYVLLENNKRISKPNLDIDVEVNTGGSGYIYNAFVKLSKEDIELLLNNKITDDKLYIFEGTVDKESANKIMGYLKCLVQNNNKIN